MLHTTWLDPYDHFLACAADYQARFGGELPWLFGRNGLAQKTSTTRVVYCPPESGIVERSLAQRYIGLTQLSQESMPTTIEWDGIGVEIHIFGTREQLFTRKTEDAVIYGLRDKVGTVLRYSEVGPKNFKTVSKRWMPTDFSNSPTAMWEWIILGTLWVPVFDLTPDDEGTPLPIGQATFSGE